MIIHRKPKFKALTGSLILSLCLIGTFVVFHLLSVVKILRTENMESAIVCGSGLHGIIAFLAIMSGTICFAWWLYSATYNKVHIGYDRIAHRKAISPTEALYSVFIPIVQVYKPYIAVKEVWISANRTFYDDENCSKAFLNVWWVLHLFMVFKFFIKLVFLKMSRMEVLFFSIADISIALIYFAAFAYMMLKVTNKQNQLIADFKGKLK
jgi:hypothetical protein